MISQQHKWYLASTNSRSVKKQKQTIRTTLEDYTHDMFFS